MQKFKLNLEKREAVNPNKLRQTGKIPATIYGRGIESQSVQVDAKEFSKLPPAAFSHILDLEGAQKASALVRHVHRKATSNQVLNIEFYQVEANRKLTVTVPLKYIGTSPAVKLGGQLSEFHQEAEVECLPKDIPDCLEVDLSTIVELDQGIHFGDLKVPTGVEILNAKDELIARVAVPRIVEEPVAAAAEGAAEGEAAATAEGAEGAKTAASTPAEKEKEKA